MTQAYQAPAPQHTQGYHDTAQPAIGDPWTRNAIPLPMQGNQPGAIPIPGPAEQKKQARQEIFLSPIQVQELAETDLQKLMTSWHLSVD